MHFAADCAPSSHTACSCTRKFDTPTESHVSFAGTIFEGHSRSPEMTVLSSLLWPPLPAISYVDKFANYASNLWTWTRIKRLYLTYSASWGIAQGWPLWTCKRFSPPRLVTVQNSVVLQWIPCGRAVRMGGVADSQKARDSIQVLQRRMGCRKSFNCRIHHFNILNWFLNGLRVHFRNLRRPLNTLPEEALIETGPLRFGSPVRRYRPGHLYPSKSASLAGSVSMVGAKSVPFLAPAGPGGSVNLNFD